MSAVAIVPFRFEGSAIVVQAKVNGKDTDLLIDNGHGTAFNGADFQRLGLLVGESFGTVLADVTLGDVTFKDVEGQIDLTIRSSSRIGFPFFRAHTEELVINFARMELSFKTDDAEEAQAKARTPRKTPTVPKAA